MNFWVGLAWLGGGICGYFMAQMFKETPIPNDLPVAGKIEQLPGHHCKLVNTSDLSDMGDSRACINLTVHVPGVKEGEKHLGALVLGKIGSDYVLRITAIGDRSLTVQQITEAVAEGISATLDDIVAAGKETRH